MRRVHVIISGRVQGVGFRYHTRQMGDRLGVTGWVRNRADGTVEAEAEGDAEAVAELLAWLGEGPPGAQVQDVRIADVDPVGGSGFQVRF